VSRRHRDPSVLNYSTSYSYDLLDNLISTSQGGSGGQTRVFTYDMLSRLQNAANPESGTTSYTYDANGNVHTRADARSITTTYAYDALNRLTGKSYTDGTPAITYEYDKDRSSSPLGTNPSTCSNGSSGNYCVGRLTQVKSSVSTNTYQKYDPLGRILASNQNTGGAPYSFTYLYNLAGGLTQEGYPSGRQVQYTFDGAGREQTLTGYVLSAQYAAHGELSSVNLANGLYDTTNFSPRLEVTGRMLGSTPGASDKWSLQNNYYANSNVQNQTIVTSGLNVTQNYTYDSVNRLTAASETAGGVTNWARTHNYDAFGNMWIVRGCGVGGCGVRLTLTIYFLQRTMLCGRSFAIRCSEQ
jgi:YD repeat-containing protein